MDTKTTIEDKLKQQFSPQFLQVDNESHMHNVPAGSQSHFKVVVVSAEFNDKRLVQRHRLINQCLAHELQNGMHALAIHTFTAQEWSDKQDKEMQSPQCAGGGKSS